LPNEKLSAEVCTTRWHTRSELITNPQPEANGG